MRSFQHCVVGCAGKTACMFVFAQSHALMSLRTHAAELVPPGCLSFGPIEKYFMFSVTLACARRTGAAVRVERRRRER